MQKSNLYVQQLTLILRGLKEGPISNFLFKKCQIIKKDMNVKYSYIQLIIKDYSFRGLIMPSEARLESLDTYQTVFFFIYRNSIYQITVISESNMKITDIKENRLEITVHK